MPFRTADIERGIAHLQQRDQILATHIERVGPFLLRTHRDRFELLVRSILSQQISTKAARSIRLRLSAAVGDKKITPEALNRLADPELRAVGLSAQKVRYLRDLSERVLDGRLVLARLGRQSDEDVIEALVQVHGIGRWTAQMFLIFALGRLDVFPHDDLGLRAAIRELYGFAELPGKADCHAIAEQWRPYSTIGTWYAWRLSDLKSDPTQDASRYPV